MILLFVSVRGCSTWSSSSCPVPISVLRLWKGRPQALFTGIQLGKCEEVEIYKWWWSHLIPPQWGSGESLYPADTAGKECKKYVPWYFAKFWLAWIWSRMSCCCGSGGRFELVLGAIDVHCPKEMDGFDRLSRTAEVFAKGKFCKTWKLLSVASAASKVEKAQSKSRLRFNNWM